jgi:hypothetical protein
MNRFAGNIVTAHAVALAFLALSDLSRTAFAQNVYPPGNPPLADSGWTAKYNELLLACYQGNMRACDRVASDPGMVFNTPIWDYASSCGGRFDKRTATRLTARMFERGIRGGMCSNVFGQ